MKNFTAIIFEDELPLQTTITAPSIEEAWNIARASFKDVFAISPQEANY